MARGVPALAGALGAVVLAVVTLGRERVSETTRRRARIGLAPVEWLRSLHTGQVGDAVAWLTLGVSALAGLMILAMH